MGISYVSTKTPTVKAPTYSTPSAYSSKYATRLDNALDTVVNWSYDPTKDANYQSLAKLYTQRGEQAARNTMGDAASLNGGYGTSYAVSAAQQARNDYNSEFAEKAIDLEDKAYNRASTSLSALRDADDTSYSRYRDTVSDKQWNYEQTNNNYWNKLNYQSDNKWNALNYNVDVYSAKKSNSSGSKKKSSSKKSSSGSSSSGTTSSSSSGFSAISSAAKANQKNKK